MVSRSANHHQKRVSKSSPSDLVRDSSSAATTANGLGPSAIPIGFTGTFVRTRKVRDAGGDIVLPDDWAKDPSYEARRPQDLQDTSVDLINRKAEDTEGIAWHLTGLGHVKLALFRSKVLEEVFINWKPCWVPLHLIYWENQDKLASQLVEEKKTYEALPNQNKSLLRKNIPQFVGRILARASIMREDCFDARQIIKYARIIVKEKGVPKEIEVVKADFKPTYEHCSSLVDTKTLWLELYERRLEACTSMLKTSKSKVLKKFQQDTIEDIRKLKESVRETPEPNALPSPTSEVPIDLDEEPEEGELVASEE